MATPTGRDIRIALKPMGNTMVDFLLVWIGFVIRLADTLGDDFRVTFFVTRVLAICTLHACSILQEISTESATHNVIELLCNEFVSLFFMDLFLLLANSTLSIETNVKWPSIL